MTSAASNKEAFGVYVHWPFCLSKCPYCDFNSHVRHAADRRGSVRRAFAREIETTAARAPGREVSSIFLGGGTPSLMQPQTVGAILDAIGKHWRVAPDVEVTLEANPTSVEADALSRLSRRRRQSRVARRAGAGRRLAEGARTPAHRARGARCGRRSRARAFDRYSFDLIYARPDQTPQMWAEELKRAIAEAAEHLSLYQLTIEAGHAVFRPACRRQAEDPRRGAGARAVRRDAGSLRSAWSAGLRDFQSRAAGRGMQTQSGLLARRGICRDRSRRAWPARYRGLQARDRDRKAPRGLADAGRGQWPRRRHRTIASTARSAPTNSC